MARRIWLSVIMLAAISSGAGAGSVLMLDDRVDDHLLVHAVSGQKPVKAFAGELEALERTITVNKREKIEKLLGKPAKKPEKEYAMPIAQPRGFHISGIHYADPKKNKDHEDFYPVGDFAGIEVWYGIDGETPRFALLYFKVDATFPKLKKLEDKAIEKPAKQLASTRKHTIDVDHWNKMEMGMNKEADRGALLGPRRGLRTGDRLPDPKLGMAPRQ